MYKRQTQYYVAMETIGENESEGSREPDSRRWVEFSKKSRQETNEEDDGGLYRFEQEM